MGLFKKENCECCGKQVGALFRTKLADGKFVCDDCDRECSEFFRLNFMKKFTYPEYCEYLEHKKENKKKLEEFEITDTYFDSVLVDMNKGWFIFDKNAFHNVNKSELIEKNYEVFEAKDLCYYNFLYKVKDVKEGVFSDKVTADVYLTVAFDNKWYPYAFCDKVLKNARHKATISGIINKSLTITESQAKEDLELYLLSILMENGIQIPMDLGGKLTRSVDLEPYRPYFEKMFEVKKNCITFDSIMEYILDSITPSAMVKRQIKKEFKIK